MGRRCGLLSLTSWRLKSDWRLPRSGEMITPLLQYRVFPELWHLYAPGLLLFAGNKKFSCLFGNDRVDVEARFPHSNRPHLVSRGIISIVASENNLYNARRRAKCELCS